MSKFDDFMESFNGYAEPYKALAKKAFEAGQQAGPDTKPANKEFDLSNIKTCVNADDVCAGDYGIFANNIGDMERFYKEKQDGTRGYITKIRDKNDTQRFDRKLFWKTSLFYPLEGAK